MFGLPPKARDIFAYYFWYIIEHDTNFDKKPNFADPIVVSNNSHEHHWICLRRFIYVPIWLNLERWSFGRSSEFLAQSFIQFSIGVRILHLLNNQKVSISQLFSQEGSNVADKVNTVVKKMFVSCSTIYQKYNTKMSLVFWGHSRTRQN